jgi:hypothetical protein
MMGEILSPAPEKISTESFKAYVDKDVPHVMQRFSDAVPEREYPFYKNNYVQFLMKVNPGLFDDYVLDYGVDKDGLIIRRGRLFRDQGEGTPRFEALKSAQVNFIGPERQKSFKFVFDTTQKAQSLKEVTVDINSLKEDLGMPLVQAVYENGPFTASKIYLAAENKEEIRKYLDWCKNSEKNINIDDAPGAHLKFSEGASTALVYLGSQPLTSRLLRNGEDYESERVYPYKYRFYKDNNGNVSFSRINMEAGKHATVYASAINLKDFSEIIKGSMKDCSFTKYPILLI